MPLAHVGLAKCFVCLSRPEHPQGGSQPLAWPNTSFQLFVATLREPWGCSVDISGEVRSAGQAWLPFLLPDFSLSTCKMELLTH